MKNIAFFLGHPAHYHLFKHTVSELRNKGYDVLYVIKQKDILEELLEINREKYISIRGARSNSRWGMIKSVLEMEYKMVRFIHSHKINLLIGTTLTFATRYFTNAKVIMTVEDDIFIVPQLSKIAYPYADVILSPITCDNGKYNLKSIKYKGYHKLAYLHPKRFTPNIKIVNQYINTNKPYFILRFAKLTAFHDVGAKISGMNDELAKEVVLILEKYGDVYISSERKLCTELEKYRLNINPTDIHHIMYYSTLFLGDSQSMAVEAAMLGTPSIRYNDFAGRIGVLEELEHKYNLTFGIKSSHPEQLFLKVHELLSIGNLKEEFHKRRDRMINDKIDVSSFFTWFIENYPDSKQIIKDSPNIQHNSKSIN